MAERIDFDTNKMAYTDTTYFDLVHQYIMDNGAYREEDISSSAGGMHQKLVLKYYELMVDDLLATVDHSDRIYFTRNGQRFGNILKEEGTVRPEIIYGVPDSTPAETKEKEAIVLAAYRKLIDEATLSQSHQAVHAGPPISWEETDMNLDKLLAHLNSWDKEELDAYERPEAYPNFKTSGESNAWIAEHKKRIKRFNAKFVWDKKQKQYSYQKLPAFEDRLSDAYKRDSILIENHVEFYNHNESKEKNAIRIQVKITNKGSQLIPNLMRASDRSNYIQLYYNETDAHDMNLVNGIESPISPYFLGEGESGTFETGALLVEGSFIYKYGKIVEVKWGYLGAYSPVVKADLDKREIVK